MGLDLYMLPFDNDGPPITFSHTILDCHRDAFFFKLFQQDEGQSRVPDDFTSFLGRDEESGERTYGKTMTTPYGEPLRYILAGQILLSVAGAGYTPESHKNKAILAYLRELPADTKIALYWH